MGGRELEFKTGKGRGLKISMPFTPGCVYHIQHFDLYCIKVLLYTTFLCHISFILYDRACCY